jgi:hypothetical protein
MTDEQDQLGSKMQRFHSDMQHMLSCGPTLSFAKIEIIPLILKLNTHLKLND